MISSYDFGRIVIDGRTYTSDVIITPEGVDGSWWRQSGHSVILEDIKKILEAGPEVVVLGQGKPGMMKAAGELKAYLQDRGIRLIEEPTARAVKTFNRLREEGSRACAGFHLTC